MVYTSQYFDVLSVVSAVVWLVILVFIAFLIQNQIKDGWFKKVWMYAVLLKLFFSLIFGLVYILIVGGGDTTAYWEAAEVMNNMFFHSPSLYLDHLLSTPGSIDYYTYFSPDTGYPPGWIYRESEGYFVGKVTSVISFGTFKSYLATSFIYAFISTIASWKLFIYLHSKNLFNKKLLAIGILFIPSVAFWTSGVSKDTIVFSSSLFLIVALLKLIDNSKSFRDRISWLRVINIVLFSFLIYHIRNFILYTIIACFAFAILTRVVRIKKDEFVVNILKQSFLFISVISLFLFLGGKIINEDLTQASSVIEEAAIVKKDFARNTTYGDNKYSLGEVEYTFLGLIKVFPRAIFIGIYEPLPWNVRNLLVVINGFEGVFFFALTFLFLYKKALSRFRFIFKRPILSFAFIFTILIGFMAGFTSIIYGVLVRIRAPLLPFLMILLSVDWKHYTKVLVRQKAIRQAMGKV